MDVVTLINCFEVPPGKEETFFALWREVNAYAQSRPGYLGHTLHRSLDSTARNRYVNVARWASREQLEAAGDAHFRELVSDPAWAPFTSTPALYEVVHRWPEPDRPA